MTIESKVLTKAKELAHNKQVDAKAKQIQKEIDYSPNAHEHKAYFGNYDPRAGKRQPQNYKKDGLRNG